MVFIIRSGQDDIPILRQFPVIMDALCLHLRGCFIEAHILTDGSDLLMNFIIEFRLAGALDHAVEMHTFRQFYQTFRFEKDEYPASSLDLMAQLKEPMQENQDWMIGERVLYEMSLDEISQLLPRLYPDVVRIPGGGYDPGH